MAYKKVLSTSQGIHVAYINTVLLSSTSIHGFHSISPPVQDGAPVQERSIRSHTNYKSLTLDCNKVM